MNLMQDQNDSVTIILRFGGFLTQVKNQMRRRYDGRKQKSIKFLKENLYFHVLREEVEVTCPWLRDSNYDLYYHICGTSPKDYTLITNEDDVRSMIAHSNVSRRVEVVVTIEDNEEAIVCPQGGEVRDNIIASNYNRSSSNFFYNDRINQEDCTERISCTQVRDDVDLILGARFPDAASFRHAVRSSAISKNFGVRFIANNRSRVVAICSHRGCPWRVRGALCRDGSFFEIRKLEEGHLCSGVNKVANKQATCSWVAQKIEESIQKNPDITPKLINNNLEGTYGLSLPYMKLWRAREKARERIYGSVDDNYRWVPALRAELISRNPGSHIAYLCSNEDLSFKRFYTSFKVSIDGFIAGCRHLIGLDACYLKSKYLGVLLVANSLDGNNGLFTLAFAVAEIESKYTWQWFLENFAQSLGNSINHLAFISDMEKGLAEAIKTIFPDAEHRVCLHHLWKNLKKFFHLDDNHKIKTLIWSSANSYIKSEFENLMNELSIICPQVHHYLMSLPYKWSKCDFGREIKNHDNTNNMSELFNSWIGEAMSMPAVDLIDMIRAMLMEQRAERKQNSLTWKGELVPYAEEYLRDITTRNDQFIIRQMMPTIAEVDAQRKRYVVDIDSRDCTCGVWQLSGLPCIHAAAFIGMKEHPLWHTYVHDSYYVLRYKMAYEGSISAMPGKDQWCVNNDGIIVGVPKSLRLRGRPKKRRIQNFLETGGTKDKKVHKCGRCGLWGHHRSTCKNPLSQTEPHQSQIEATDLEQTSGDSSKAKLSIRCEGGEASWENLMLIEDSNPLIQL